MDIELYRGDFLLALPWLGHSWWVSCVCLGEEDKEDEGRTYPPKEGGDPTGKFGGTRVVAGDGQCTLLIDVVALNILRLLGIINDQKSRTGLIFRVAVVIHRLLRPKETSPPSLSPTPSHVFFLCPLTVKCSAVRCLVSIKVQYKVSKIRILETETRVVVARRVDVVAWWSGGELQTPEDEDKEVRLRLWSWPG